MITMVCATCSITETCLPFGYVAELAASFLCADLGVAHDPRDNTASYLASWLTKWRARHFFNHVPI
ncbi:MAG: hypothetical protein E5X73_36440 [Mesorhizobium sp.]|nr:MAG: hypothetical protein E5X73_36440 [Mesorhizobium sp.]